jgi:hypothetical protein
LLRLSEGMADPGAEGLRSATVAYLQAAIDKDWPAMRSGLGSPLAIEGLDGIYAALLSPRPSAPRDIALLSEGLYQADQLTEARRARVVAASGVVPGVIWLVLIVGALATICFTFFFGAESIVAQVLMTGGLSVMIFTGLLTVVAMDSPFSGIVRVDSAPLETVLRDFTDLQQSTGSD